MLRIGVHQLSGGQAGLVRALIQLLAQGSSNFPWKYANEGPYDALIVDAQSVDIRDPQFRGSAKAISALGEPPATVPADLEVLEWPLRADRLESWLMRVQRTLGALPAADSPAKGPDGAPPSVRYKLKRWPPDALLHGDAQRIRLATLLSRKPLDEQELARLSGQDAERCHTFIQLLQGFKILEAESQAPLPARPASAPTATAHAGLIRSIRRRLGL
jgi:hypothetical protein